MIIKINNRKTEWHTWFAWRPVNVYMGKDENKRAIYGWIWFENVKRKLTRGYIGDWYTYSRECNEKTV